MVTPVIAWLMVIAPNITSSYWYWLCGYNHRGLQPGQPTKGRSTAGGMRFASGGHYGRLESQRRVRLPATEGGAGVDSNRSSQTAEFDSWLRWFRGGFGSS